MRPVILRVKIARPEDVGRFVAESGEGCEVVFYAWESQAESSKRPLLPRFDTGSAGKRGIDPQ